MEIAANTGSEQVERVADGTFAPGFSGNPKGRPHGKELATRIREALEDATDVEALVRNVAMVQEIADKGADPKDRMTAAKIIREWNVPAKALEIDMRVKGPMTEEELQQALDDASAAHNNR